jgi:predicted SAM-dependent methyltransferase
MDRKVAGRIHDGVVRAWAYLRRGRRIRPVQRPVKVNVGSGLVVAPGWIHLDVGIIALAASWPGPLKRLAYRLLPDTSAARRDYSVDAFCEILSSNRFYHHRLEYGLPFANDQVDFLYASHVVEHLFRSDAQRLFGEAHRVLRPGGVLRICVPDLAHAVGLLNRGDTERGLEYFFADAGPSEFTRHRYLYDYAHLSAYLMAAGFDPVTRRSYREGVTPDLELLDSREEETLFVEATKPANTT